MKSLNHIFVIILLTCAQFLHISTVPNATNSKKHVIYDVQDFSHSNSSSKIVIDLLNQRRSTMNPVACAFMNVSHNASYTIYDREEYSEGLEHIHNTSEIFEEFYNIVLQPGCEATICELVLLDPVARSRKCYSFNESRDFTTVKISPDPATHNYFVSTGCSCKEVLPSCHSQTCDNVQLDGECAKLYKESSCSECRYDAITLKEGDSGFIPSNGFWCGSYMIRDGCRLSVDSISQNGSKIINFANYTGSSSNISLNYVRKPIPPKLTCICDIDEGIGAVKTNGVWIISIGTISIVTLVISTLVLRKCIRIRIERKVSVRQIEHLVRRFKHGFSKEELISLDNHDQNDYVSIGYVKAVQAPYQDKWEISRNRIALGQKIGGGEFGVVYLAELFKENSRKGQPIQVACKAPKSKTISCFNSVLEEIKIWSYVGEHRNVCKFIGASTQDIPRQDALIILEYCSENNLKDYLRKHKDAFLEQHKWPEITRNSGDHYVHLSNCGDVIIETLRCNPKILKDKFKQLLKWAGEIASGMEYIHSKQVIHIDLAPRNIFLDGNLECKIGDFGLSQRYQDVVNYVRIAEEYKIPFRYMALESLTDLKFTTFSDRWSYGIALYELFSLGKDPYPKMIGFSDLVQMLQEGKRLEKPVHCSEDLYLTMLQCWDEDTQKRPDFGELKHLFECKMNTLH